MRSFLPRDLHDPGGASAVSAGWMRPTRVLGQARRAGQLGFRRRREGVLAPASIFQGRASDPLVRPHVTQRLAECCPTWPVISKWMASTTWCVVERPFRRRRGDPHLRGQLATVEPGWPDAALARDTGETTA